MKLGISAKLFFAVVITTVSAIAIMAFALRHNFRHGFLDYINTTEINSLANISDRLLQVYSEQGSWDFIRENPRLGRRLLRNFGQGMRRHSMHDDMMQHEHHGAPLPLLNRLTLLDESRRYLAGSRNVGTKSKLVPVKTDKDQIIAWLSYYPATGLTDTVDIQFQQSQVNTSLIISLAAVVFAALIAMILAKQFLSPIKQLVAATRKLSNGELDTRIAVKSNDEFGQLTKDFNGLAETLADQERARHQWLADISHELRTPVAVLRGEIEALQDGIRKTSPQTLASLHSEVLRINALIEDLYQLSLSDIGALDYHKSRINLVDVVESVIASFTGQCQQKNLRITSMLSDCEKIEIYADENRMRQLFANLFQNSIRYSDENGQVSIRCESQQDSLSIQWCDSSPGVSDEALPKLFNRLYRVDPSRDRKSGGAGLGLSICKNIVKAHNGSISAQHAQLGGLCVIITLPLTNTTVTS